MNYKIIIRTSNVKTHNINAYVNNVTNNEVFSMPVTKISENLFIGEGKTSAVVENPFTKINLYQFPDGNHETITIKDLKIYKEA